MVDNCEISLQKLDESISISQIEQPVALANEIVVETHDSRKDDEAEMVDHCEISLQKLDESIGISQIEQPVPLANEIVVETHDSRKDDEAEMVDHCEISLQKLYESIGISQIEQPVPLANEIVVEIHDSRKDDEAEMVDHCEISLQKLDESIGISQIEQPVPLANEIVVETHDSRKDDEAEMVDHCKISLQKLEESMSISRIEQFNLRLKEGYNLDIDPFYLQWKQAKLATSVDKAISSHRDVALTGFQSAVPSANTPSSGIQRAKSVSPILKDILVYPEHKTKNDKGKARKVQAPSHLTSQQFLSLCEEKEKRKQEEEELKVKNRLERQEKALQRKKEQDKKAEERKKKMEERARKKEEEQRRKEERKVEKEQKRQEKETRKRRKTLCPTADSEDLGAAEVQGTSVSILIDNEGPSTSGISTSQPRPKRARVSNNVPRCGLCGTREDSSDAEENWIQCSNCDKWYEEMCAEVFIEDMKDLEWFCPTCI